MIDVHNHLQDPRFLGRQSEIIETMKETGITGCVVTGTSETDWPEVARLADKFPDFISPAFGLHPWKINSRSSVWLETLKNYLHRFPHATLGECGLDRWMKSPNLEDQHQIFREQMNLALSLDRPITIHCLKAWGPMMSELRGFQRLPPFLFHSFGGSLEIGEKAARMGGFFSFSGYFLQPKKARTREIFSRLPIERILVETDAPEMALPNPKFQFKNLNHPANLAFISRELAKICDTEQETFTTNTYAFWGEDQKIR
ncbi:MAG TPA: TatD family deoxyribonuclease [Verrucomicrobiales bacterium]|nr:TatD family deoxyribonuclease [Verrucomicrobiales bacterium]